MEGDDRYNLKTVSAKLTRSEFSEFKDYCDRKGAKVSPQLKKMIRQELENPVSANVAGRSIFEYSPSKDSFAWKIVLDTEETSYIENDVSSEFLEQLKKSVEKAIEERHTFLQKKNKDSVAVPERVVRRGQWRVK